MGVPRHDLCANLVHGLEHPGGGQGALKHLPTRCRVTKRPAEAPVQPVRQVRAIDDGLAGGIAEIGKGRPDRAPRQCADDNIRRRHGVRRTHRPASGLGGKGAHRTRLGVAGASGALVTLTVSVTRKLDDVPVFRRLTVLHARDVDDDDLGGAEGLGVREKGVQHDKVAVLQDAATGPGDPRGLESGPEPDQRIAPRGDEGIALDDVRSGELARTVIALVRKQSPEGTEGSLLQVCAVGRLQRLWWQAEWPRWRRAGSSSRERSCRSSSGLLGEGRRLDEIDAAGQAAHGAFVQSTADAGQGIGGPSTAGGARYLGERIALAITQRASGEDRARSRKMLGLALSVFIRPSRGLRRAQGPDRLRHPDVVVSGSNRPLRKRSRTNMIRPLCRSSR